MTASHALELVHKLLRVARPSSGATVAERSNAATRAGELIARHDLIVVAAAPVTGFTRFETARHYEPAPYYAEAAVVYAEPLPQVPIASQLWRSRSAFTTWCAKDGCHGFIASNQEVWRRIRNGAIEYLHVQCL